jgi:uncharacterized protein (TIGR03000 family)
MKTARLALAVLVVGLAFAVSAATAGGNQPITLTVLVPADAQVELDGHKTKSAGETRRYQTPPLAPGKAYKYNLKVTSGGKVVTRDVKVSHGEKNVFDFRPDFPAGPGPGASDEEAVKLATEAYVYGYPLVTMEMTRRVMTNTETPGNSHAPMGQFYLSRTYPDAKFRDVTAPNADTLYSTAWLDLTKEPYVFSLPEQKDRYYLMPMLSGWTDVFEVPGTRTTGDKAQKYLVTGPNWTGEVPAGVKQLKSPTNMVWILGRTYCTGTPDDYKAVHALQDQYGLVPLSAYGKPYTPPKGKVDPKIDMKTPVREQVNNMDAVTYFQTLAELMASNPPAKEDGPMVAKLAKLGIAPGKPYNPSRTEAKKLAGVPKAALEQIVAHFRKAGREENGWTYFPKTGVYGTDYLQRAFITYFGLGANRPQDAVYPTSEVDAEGKEYSGANKYVVTFKKGQTPPAKGFWSITMYNKDYFFVANPLNRYTVSSRSDFKQNKDGSTDVYIQNESPGKELESNWLPAPKGEFVLMMRLYWPQETPPSIIDGSWTIPGVRRAEK